MTHRGPFQPLTFCDSVIPASPFLQPVQIPAEQHDPLAYSSVSPADLLRVRSARSSRSLTKTLKETGPSIDPRGTLVVTGLQPDCATDHHSLGLATQPVFHAPPCLLQQPALPQLLQEDLMGHRVASLAGAHSGPGDRAASKATVQTAQHAGSSAPQASFLQSASTASLGSAKHDSWVFQPRARATLIQVCFVGYPQPRCKQTFWRGCLPLTHTATDPSTIPWDTQHQIRH